jgi:hypothetical protein
VFRVTTTPDGIELLELAAGPGETPLGVLRDRRNGWLAAVLAVRGSSFALLDSDGQLRLFDGWRSVLGTMARAGTPVRRLQWVQVSEPAGDAGALVAPPERPGFEAAVASYRQLIDGAAPTVVRHDAFLVVAVSGGRRPGGPGGGPPDAEALRREVRLLGGQLRNADLGAGPALDLDGLFRLIGSRHAQPTGRRGPGWAMATDEAWSCLRVDGTWHATFWVAEWPRVAVGPDFLLPMLLGDGRRAMSVVMAPVPAERAARQARAARAADVADEELRSRAGFLPNARRNREADGVVRLEAELADGHAQYRFSGYVTVTAPDRAALEAACVETEQAAQAAHLELRRLYGRQAEAYTWTLPLCRGLA